MPFKLVAYILLRIKFRIYFVKWYIKANPNILNSKGKTRNLFCWILLFVHSCFGN